MYRGDIAALAFGDPDDALRMVQVRDFLGGQPWYDTRQYRINPAGGGGAIHWSRFIDAQIGGLILLLDPLLGRALAERAAVAVYPLLLLGLFFALMARLLARLGDRTFVLTGLVIAATTVTYLHYFVPLRIDHHGWQLLLSLAMLWLALGPSSFLRGFVAALVISLHLEISLEGLPYLVIFGGLFAWEWLRDADEAPRLRGFATGLIVVPALWILLLRGTDAVFGVHCDAFSRPYLLGAAVAGAIIALALHQPARFARLPSRLALLAVAGGSGALAFALGGPDCLAGPFGELSPLVREHWYEGIGEGHPIWTQSAMSIGVFGLPSLGGLAALFWSLRRAEAANYARAWRRLVPVALAGLLLSLFVLRTTAVAHAYLIPAFVLPLLAFVGWARGLRHALPRIAATVAAILLLPVSLAALGSLIMGQLVGDQSSDMPVHCLDAKALAPLQKMPATIFFTPMDMAPALLVGSPHSVIATGHHRNHRAMHHLLATFMADPVKAEAGVRATGASHILFCANLADFRNLAKVAPKSLAADLAAHRALPWLEREPALGNGPLYAYRLKPE
jgi:hypothetical protein